MVFNIRNGFFYGERKNRGVRVGFFGLFVATHQSGKDPTEDKNVHRLYMCLGLCVVGTGPVTKIL